jgi:hypothetical protein
MPTTTFTKLPSTNLSKSVLANLTDTTIDSGTKSALSNTLNTALKSQLTAASNSAATPSWPISFSRFLDLAADKDLSLHDFVSKELTLASDLTQQAAVETAISNLSITTTIPVCLG